MSVLMSSWSLCSRQPVTRLSLLLDRCPSDLEARVKRPASSGVGSSQCLGFPGAGPSRMPGVFLAHRVAGAPLTAWMDLPRASLWSQLRSHEEIDASAVDSCFEARQAGTGALHTGADIGTCLSAAAAWCSGPGGQRVVAEPGGLQQSRPGIGVSRGQRKPLSTQPWAGGAAAAPASRR